MNFSLEQTEKYAKLLAPLQVEILQKEGLMPLIKVNPADIKKVIQTLRDHKDSALKYLNVISGNHLTETNEEGEIKSLGVEIFYVISNGTDFSGVAIRTDLPEGNLNIDTIDTLYGSANWFEREIYDLLGVNFVGSRDLRRIMLPDDWEGHPLRKDFQEKSSYNDIPTTRPDELGACRVEL